MVSHRIAFLPAAFCFLGAICLAGIAQGRALDAGQLQRLKAGEVLISVEPDDSGEADGKIEAAIRIPAPPSGVWVAMLDCGRALKFVTGLTSCRVLETGPGGTWDVREHHSKWLSILPETISVFRSDYIQNKEIRFQRVSGTLRFLQGSWRLEPLSGGAGTQLSYSARIGVAVPLPGFMIRGAIEEDVPKLLKALRDDVLKGK